jgi:hypothetical protein
MNDCRTPSKAYYLQQVHQPRHLPESARLFSSPALEVSVCFTLHLYVC